jgi:hypothetical protein
MDIESNMKIQPIFNLFNIRETSFVFSREKKSTNEQLTCVTGNTELQEKLYEKIGRN